MKNTANEIKRELRLICENTQGYKTRLIPCANKEEYKTYTLFLKWNKVQFTVLDGSDSLHYAFLWLPKENTVRL